MNSQEFVDVLKQSAESDVESIIDSLKKPSGRTPCEERVRLSKWFNECTSDQKAKILEVIKLSVQVNLFGLLCFLDGVRSIEDGPNKGELFLYYEKNGNRILLNDTSSEYLHDMI